MMSERKLGFWRWFRTIPILIMLALCVMTAALRFAPQTLVRSVFLPVKYADIIEDASARYGVDEKLICAVIKCESDWDPNATSSAGAIGLMQLMPSTASELIDLGQVSSAYDYNNLTDPATNIEFGTAYLAFLQRNLDSQDAVIAAYNAGLGAVTNWLSQGDDISEQITYAETATYLIRVNEAYKLYTKYYPEGISG